MLAIILDSASCRLRPRFLLVLLAIFLAGNAKGQETNEGAFLYRGHLNESSLPSTGSYDFSFRLADALENGSYLGNPLTNSAVAVTNGHFSVRLDFGTKFFDGAPRWLEIRVRTNGGSEAFNVLAPRQEILAVPYAQHAFSSANAALAKSLIDGGGSLTNIPAAFLTGTVPLAGLSGISSAQMNSTTDRAYLAGNSNRVSVINVKDFGALGNGVSDDTIAISNAWNALITRGGTLYFPPGVYLDSGTHSNTVNAPGKIDFIDGRLVQGGGSVRWHYTGHSQLFYTHDASPDFDGFEFFCSTDATNCMYISNPGSNVSIRNCFFHNWTNATLGALMMDEADSVNLVNLYAFKCKIGFGLGFRCNHLIGDLETYLCDVGVAVGIPTANYFNNRQSYNIDLNIMALYCSNAVAMDAGITGATVRGYFWNCTNAPVTLGKIPGVSTNYAGLGVHSVTLNHCYFQGSDAYGYAINLYGHVVRSLSVVDCWFDQTAQSKALIKSFTPLADMAPIRWASTYRSLTRPEFEDSNGKQLAEISLFQNRDLNQGLGLYNTRKQTGWGGSGFILDVLDSSFGGPIARFGVPARPDATFDSFRGGLTVSYNAAQAIPQVTVTNADLVLTPPGTVASASSPGTPGAIRWDSDYIYICIDSNGWRRAPLTSW
jgi:hypothetical protein